MSSMLTFDRVLDRAFGKAIELPLQNYYPEDVILEPDHEFVTLLENLSVKFRLFNAASLKKSSETIQTHDVGSSVYFYSEVLIYLQNYHEKFGGSKFRIDACKKGFEFREKLLALLLEASYRSLTIEFMRDEVRFILAKFCTDKHISFLMMYYLLRDLQDLAEELGKVKENYKAQDFAKLILNFLAMKYHQERLEMALQGEDLADARFPFGPLGAITHPKDDKPQNFIQKIHEVVSDVLNGNKTNASLKDFANACARERMIFERQYDHITNFVEKIALLVSQNYGRNTGLFFLLQAEQHFDSALLNLYLADISPLSLLENFKQIFRTMHLNFAPWYRKPYYWALLKQ